jgi:hypothetical protein
MKLNEIETGTIFTIGETPTYPKLRTDSGYIDMRDKIIKNCDDLQWELRIMTKEEVAEKFEGTVQEVEDWIKECVG